jgi:O-antigen/teichoic acid export membrane protein
VNIELERGLTAVAKGAGITAVGMVLGQGIGFVTRVVAARYLGPADFGVLAMALSIFGMVSIVAAGGMQGGTYTFVSLFNGRKDYPKIKGTLITALTIVLVLSGIVAALLWGLNSRLTELFRAPMLAAVMIPLILAMPAASVATVCGSAAAGFKAIKYKVAAEYLVKPGVRLAVLVSALYTGFGLIGAAWAYAIGFWAAAVAALYWLQRRVFNPFNSSIRAEHVSRELLDYSWPLVFTTLLWGMVGEIGTLMLGLLRSAAETGLYTAALNAAQLIIIVPGALVALLMPVLADNLFNGRRTEAKLIYQIATKWILLVVVPLVGLLILAPGTILSEIFGAEYTTAASVITIAAAGYLVYSVFNAPAYEMLSLHKRSRTLLAITATAALTNILLGVVLIPVYGIQGAALATAGAFAISSGLITIFAWKASGMHQFRGSLLKIAAAGLVPLLVLSVLTPVYGLNHLLTVAIFITSYLALLVLFRTIEAEDVLIVNKVASKVGMAFASGRRP